jgi:predicted RNase H-like HicB family nuclease
MKLKVLVRNESVGGYSVSVPALPGCFSQGETLQEAMENIREAGELWLEVASDTAAAQAKIDLKPGTQKDIMKVAGLTEADL